MARSGTGDPLEEGDDEEEEVEEVEEEEEEAEAEAEAGEEDAIGEPCTSCILF